MFKLLSCLNQTNQGPLSLLLVFYNSDVVLGTVIFVVLDVTGS